VATIVEHIGPITGQENAMLWNASAMIGYAIEANDGRVGTVSDFLFDDTSWLIRWLVVDTGKWLSGRKVLLPPGVLGHIDQKREEFVIRLTTKEIENSPEISADRPVSRQMESHLYDYYGWNPYWAGSLYMGSYGYMDGAIGGPLSPEARRREERIANAQRDDDDPHLRSAAAVSGYHIHALDGEIGHVEDFFVEDADWSIHYLLVDTKNWWPGKKVLISPRSAKTIDWAHKLVNLNVVRQKVKDSPAYDPSYNIDRAYERNFHSYYGGVRPSHPL
jgi:sporulation protein YlmC with PRC-barrel domain